MSEPYPLLENAPAHETPEFLQYLRDNNAVVYECADWLVIENCKYHTPEKPWLTAFAKKRMNRLQMGPLTKEYGHLEWKKKAPDKQTIKRFHFHLYQAE